LIDLAREFTYHPPKEGQAERYEEIRAAGRDFAEIVVGECPTSTERTTAIRKIQEAVMWANASIAVNE
jgi:hypothetical protein